MRIVDIRETTVPIASPIRNAFIDFSKMTCSVVAVITDVVRDGELVVGYGFHSNGRYAASGLMRERFLPRLREANPNSLLADVGDNFDPERIWATMMASEKPRSTWPCGTRPPRSPSGRCSTCSPNGSGGS
jgi:hypothetical protein